MNNRQTGPPNRAPSPQPSYPGANMIPAQTVSMLPAQQPCMIPAQQPNMIPAQTVNMVPAQQPNMIPAQTVNMVPAQLPNMIPAQKANMIPAQQPNMISAQTVNMVPAQQPNMISAQPVSMVPAQQPNMLAVQRANMVPAQVQPQQPVSRTATPPLGAPLMSITNRSASGGPPLQQQLQQAGGPVRPIQQQQQQGGGGGGALSVVGGAQTFPNRQAAMAGFTAANMQTMLQQMSKHPAEVQKALLLLARTGGVPVQGGGIPGSIPMGPPPPSRRDPKKLVPRAGLDYALKVARLAPKFKNDAGVERALQTFYEDFIENAINFGCSQAKRRKAAQMKPRDIAVYLERIWQLYIPGFTDDERLRPYRKIVGNSLHLARHRAARHAAPADFAKQPPVEGVKGGKE